MQVYLNLFNVMSKSSQISFIEDD